jgi:hypothetical protein
MNLEEVYAMGRLQDVARVFVFEACAGERPSGNSMTWHLARGAHDRSDVTVFEKDGTGDAARAGIAGPVDGLMTGCARQDGRLIGMSEPGPNGVAVVVQVPFVTSVQALPW